MNWIGWMAGASLLGAGAPVSAGGLADVFDAVIPTMETRIFNIGATLDSDVDPLLAESASGTSFARSRFSDGDLRGQAAIADAFGDTVFAAANYSVGFKNLSDQVTTIAAGNLKLKVDARFARSFGSGAPGGTVGNTLESHLAATIVDSANMVRLAATGNLLYQYADTQFDGKAPDIRLNEALGGGVSVSHALDGDSFSAEIRAPELVVQPGDTVAIAVTMIGTATAFGFFGGSGYTATTDFGNTAQLSLVLPAGFSLQSAVPLHWVTLSPVPEASPAALLAGGLAALVLVRRARGRRAAE